MDETPEMLSIQIWVLASIGSVLFTLLIWTVKQGINSFISGLKKTNAKIESLTGEIHETNLLLASHRGEIKANSDANEEQDRRLNAHSERIRALEIKTA
jgi:hypothetical protein